MARKPRTKASERLADMVKPQPRRFTVTEIAKRLGVSRQTVTAWCSGASLPGGQHAAKIEDLTGIPAREWYAANET